LLLDAADPTIVRATRPAGMMTRFFLYQGRVALAYAFAALTSAFGFRGLWGGWSSVGGVDVSVDMVLFSG
jgi:hypothetical protein